MNETKFLIEHIDIFISNAHSWGYFIIFAFMTIESSFIPFPSEVIMIPAGFLAYRGNLYFSNPIADLVIIIILGSLGSLFGAFINYYLALYLGRPFLHKYGKYIFIKKKMLERAEETFNKYGDITTFVCRLIPGIRQIISIPAGISKMPMVRFSTFTILGAGIWVTILALIGYYLGHLSSSLSYGQLIIRGRDIIYANYVWILGIIFLSIIAYIVLKYKIKIRLNRQR